MLEANCPGRVSHVSHCGYMVRTSARRQGIARAMALHSFEQAQQAGFEAMQFNMVVSTNPAVALWQSLGFAIVGTLPEVFSHAALGRVDAHVMYKAF